MKQVKLILITCNTIYTKDDHISMKSIYIIEIFIFSFLTKSLKSGICFRLNSESQFRRVILQVLCNQFWLTATLLDSVDLELSCESTHTLLPLNALIYFFCKHL